MTSPADRGATIFSMRLRLLAFASASDALGGVERAFELAAGSRVDDLKRELLRLHPELAALMPRLAVAVDGEIVSSERELADGAEVALLPPVSGG